MLHMSVVIVWFFEELARLFQNTCGFAFADCTALLLDEAAIIDGSMALTGPHYLKRRNETKQKGGVTNIIGTCISKVPVFLATANVLVENVKFYVLLSKYIRLP